MMSRPESKLLLITNNVRSCTGFFDNLDFVFGQAVKLVDQLVDLRIGRVDLALNVCFSVIGFRGGMLGVNCRPSG